MEFITQAVEFAKNLLAQLNELKASGILETISGFLGGLNLDSLKDLLGGLLGNLPIG